MADGPRSFSAGRPIRSALSIEGIEPLLIERGRLDRAAPELIASMHDPDNPFELNGTIYRAIYWVARDNGLKIVLDGGGGDVTLGADNRIAALLRRGRCVRAVREIRGAIRFWRPGRPPSYMAREFFSGAWVALAPLRLRSWVRERRLAVVPTELNPGFAERFAFKRRRLAADHHVRMGPRADADRRTQAMLHPNLTSGRERFDQLAASFGVECRDPFMDIRLMEFCLSLPPDQLQDGGWPKIILRRAAHSLLPNGLAWRCGKEHLGWDFTRALLGSFDHWRDGMSRSDSPIVPYVSKQTLRQLREGQDEPPSGLAFRFFVLDRFLRRFGVPSE
jgi:asparagine synthase (glutamine-hydrolysing)